jgi:CRISPR-associated endonuclease/helicase Cas3
VISSQPTFTAFYEALYPGRSPFPWQVRLVEQVLQEGWPNLLDLPTGVGKTTALDVALYCLAIKPEAMPRRALLVVDRRIVVDQGADHARAIQHKLQAARNGVLKELADALRALWGGQLTDAPFTVAVLRGGMPRDNDWARRPDQPVLGVSTVDQVGSRLLFRGYGIGPKSASIHAGLLGNDTLILLDEVHLARPFAQTLEAIRSRFRRAVPGLPDRFFVVQMSATPGKSLTSARVFGLASEDRAHPTLSERLTASKLTRLVSVKVTGSDEGKKREVLAEYAVKEALTLQAGGAKIVGLVVNRVDTARLALQLLEKQQKITDVILVTGRMRPLDRDRVVHEHLLPRAGAGRMRSTDDRPFIVVATQCIEAGADLDFDGLVTECASLDALRQRFGRIDRRGELKQTHSVVLGRSDLVAAKADDPIYGGAPAATWQWLTEISEKGQLDFGIHALPSPQDAEGVLREELLAPAVDAPVMLPTHLDSWAQTSARPTPDPDVALWLHGPQKATADVQIVWRADLDLSDGRRDESVDRLNACRPSSLEAVTVPLSAARQWLGGVSKDVPPAIADVVAGSAEGTKESDERWQGLIRRNAAANQANVALRWDGDDSELIRAQDLRPGDVLIVPTAKGGLAAGSFDPDSASTVLDLADLAQLRGRGVATLRLDLGPLTAWGLPGDVLRAMPALSQEESMDDVRERTLDWIKTLPSSPSDTFVGTATEWQAALRAWKLKRQNIHVVGEQIIVSARIPKPELPDNLELSEALTEDDDSSFRQVEVTLEKHSTDVRDYADRFSKGIGLGADLAHDVALAGWFHDIGKVDPRFQRWLVGGSEVRAALLTTPLAKSALPAGNTMQRRQARKQAGYPVGCRHELLSLNMIQANEEVLDRAKDRDLVMHLVASHHGWCRPFAPPIDDSEDLHVELRQQGDRLLGTTQHHLARLDSGVPDRFWHLLEKYGWWGLAWLEAVLRLADHRASEDETEAAK